MHRRLSSPLALLLLLLAAAPPASRAATAAPGVASLELWCVAKNNADDASLRAAISWACGQGGSDCGPIQQGGPCYDPADIETTASYAFNDYYLKHGLTDDSCDFANAAALTSINPSHGNCKFPSSLSVNNGSLSGASTAVGVQPAYNDLSGCNQIAIHWYSFVIISICSTLLHWFLSEHW
ncbi:PLASMODESMATA CALLOSE-BINDING PROTEIN 5-like [Syzygium oleosum]|uniref:PLASMODESMATA CALLOSE-BINDING PROTEIN 5-like n=1 Tax=Syzygium oleosum TaxID=219896 RepID=UPI0024BA5557|nr:PLASMODESMATA CALLOSE-BINDING PROTEIN 5-like [Syzygium oleosum]